jgi:fermentation-respiration switch protein FrsA (DUF1100 family)
MKLGCYALVAYLLLWAVIYSPLYRMIVLQPDRQESSLYNTDKILGAKRQEFFIDSHGEKLHAWMFCKPGSKVLVIIHHGNGGNILNRLFLAKSFIQAGASVLLYDYRGYGKSSGELSPGYLPEDGLIVFDFAKNNFKYPITINYGESIGSGVACIVDKERKADALILQSGITMLPNVAKDGVAIFKLFPSFMWPQPQFNNCELLANSKTPLLVLHGERDKLVPCSHSQCLFDSAGTTDKAFIKLPNCGHNDVGYYDPDLFQKAVEDFLARWKTN